MFANLLIDTFYQHKPHKSSGRKHTQQIIMLELACLFPAQLAIYRTFEKNRRIIFPQLNILLPTYVEQHDNMRTINSCLPSAAIYTLAYLCRTTYEQ